MSAGKIEVIYTASPITDLEDVFFLQYEAAELDPPEWFDIPASKAANAYNAQILADATAERLRCNVRVIRVSKV